MKCSIKLLAFAIAVFSIMSYWGIRSPDSETVFRTTQALAEKHTFAVPEELSWKGFGLSRGKDQRLYSLFGPTESIAAVPFFLLGNTLAQKHIPPFIPANTSHYAENNDVWNFIHHIPPENRKPHVLRAVTGSFNLFVSALCVLLCFLTIKLLTGSEPAALLTGVLFAFGSLMLPYSGTFFSEPLATLFVMLSVYLLIRNETTPGPRHTFSALCAGLFLGLAITAHITAILFAPFFCLYAAGKGTANRTRITRFIGFAIGTGLFIALIAYYNWIRFGSLLETGRTNGETTYGFFVSPWRGLEGLLYSPGKGLLLFCPLVILSICCWPLFHKKHKRLSWMIIGTALLRVLFIASRSDWHGGFGIGPRFMILLLPLFMFPIGICIQTILHQKNLRAFIFLSIFSFICICQQLYFATGEIFSFLHIIAWKAQEAGSRILVNGQIYFEWNKSPLIHLMDGYRGPLMLRAVCVENKTLWIILSLISGLLFLLLCRRIWLLAKTEPERVPIDLHASMQQTYQNQ